MVIKRITNTLTAFVGPARVATLRNHVSTLWRWGFKVAGYYRPIPASETEYFVERQVTFKGDVPKQIIGGGYEQGRMAFRQPRPLVEDVANLIVTPNGSAWRDGCLEERFSAGQPGLRLLLEPHRPKETIQEAYIVQCAHNDTYGDWVSEYLVPVLRTVPMSAPLLLPMTVASKPFVTRDLDKIGINWCAIKTPTKIENAHVLRQQKYFVHFPEDDVKALRRLFGNPVSAARLGGLVYLSRYGEGSEVADRQYPSRIIEEIIQARGGRIIRTNEAMLEDYATAAMDAETVVFDHGSAFYNALGWPMRRAVEIASDTWWNNAFLMLGNAAGVADYTIIRGDLGTEHVQKRLSQALDAPLDASLTT